MTLAIPTRRRRVPPNDLGEGVKITLLMQLHTETLKQEKLDDKTLDENAKFRDHDFTFDELEKSPRLTRNWTPSHYWTMKRWREMILPNDPTIPDDVYWQQFRHLLDIYEFGTEVRVKLIPDRTNECKEIPDGLTHAEMIAREAWNHGFIVEFMPGEPGYDDPDTLRLQLEDRDHHWHSVGFNIGDWRNQAKYDEAMGWHNGVFASQARSATQDKPSEIKTDDIGKNSLPNTSPANRGQSDAQQAIAEIFNAVTYLQTAVNQEHRANLEDALKKADEGKLLRQGETVHKHLEQSAQVGEDRKRAEWAENVQERLASAYRFFGIDSVDTGRPSSRDPRNEEACLADLNAARETMVALATVFQEIGRGHEIVQTCWGRVPLVEPETNWVYNNATGSYERRATGRLMVSPEAFLCGHPYDWAEWVIDYQGRSTSKIKATVFNLLHTGRRIRELPLPFELSLINIYAGLLFGSLALDARLDFGVVATIAVMAVVGVGLFIAPRDPENYTRNEGWRTFIATAVLAVVTLTAGSYHSNEQQTRLATSYEQNKEINIAAGIPREKWEEMERKQAAISEAHRQFNEANKSNQPLSGLDSDSAKTIILIVLGGLVAIWLISRVQRAHYDPVSARSSWWRRPLN